MKHIKAVLMITLLISVFCLGGCGKGVSDETSSQAEEGKTSQEANTDTTEETSGKDDEQSSQESEANTAEEASGEVLEESAVQRAEITGPVLVIETGTEELKLISSESKEEGCYSEVFQKDDILNCKIERYPSAGDDIGVAIIQLAYNNGWDNIERSENAELSEKLGCAVYDISFLDDEDGFSITHKGIYVQAKEYDYFMDCFAIEGEFYRYQELIQTWFSAVNISES